MLKKIWNFFRNRKKIPLESEKYTSINLVYTPVQSLMIGMYVSELDMPWLESPFKFQGFKIETEKDLQKLRDVCQYVYIDISKQKKPKTDTGTNLRQSINIQVEIGKPPERLGTFEKEIIRAEQIYKAGY